MKYSAAIDLSGKFAGFALAETESGKILMSAHKAMHGRSSAGLSTWILELMSGFDVKAGQIDRWTIGSGPGSFTGMRLAAALIEGMTLGKDSVETRCVPGAVALGSVLDIAEGEKAAALFDGRNKEILLFELVKRGGEMVPSGSNRVLGATDAESFFADNQYAGIVGLEYELDNIRAIVPEKISNMIKWAEKLPCEKLIECKYKDFDNDLTALVYIRPAVFS